MKANQAKTPAEAFQPPATCGKCKFARDSWENGNLSLTCRNERALSHNERVQSLQLACRVFAG